MRSKNVIWFTVMSLLMLGIAVFFFTACGDDDDDDDDTVGDDDTAGAVFDATECFNACEAGELDSVVYTLPDDFAEWDCPDLNLYFDDAEEPDEFDANDIDCSDFCGVCAFCYSDAGDTPVPECIAP
ncbi:MAG: hypothetical protein P9L99_02400 [Candidatus Lernaella stagnicola]|nr:hypothetical protein [Candidatus Lernaella stagnicola]